MGFSSVRCVTLTVRLGGRMVEQRGRASVRSGEWCFGMLLTGRIVFPSGDRPEEASRVVARVEEVSRADAPAVVVAEQVQEHVVLPRDDWGSLPFAIDLRAASIDPRLRYSVRVHVDVSGTASVTSDDFVSTSSYPVEFDAGELAVEVRRV
ncbi:YbaY family lipoprotein [Kribbella sp. C-35]|uniref:YbaY family lipoprotein n=1 Tax=Kribbella sp. C-35 TaxID=2789276 RepID=UPI00397BB194